jgi:uncharacterized protein YaaN involved in tellurite resistance
MMEAMKQDIENTQAMMVKLKDLLSQSSSNMQSANKGLKALYGAIPAYFDAAESYIQTIEAKRSDIESAFQSTINGGFQQMYYAVSVFALVAAAALMFYKHKKKI